MSDAVLGPPAAPTPSPTSGDYVAAVDLGSNSFHLAIARVIGGVPSVVDTIREQVQLARGLDKKGHLDLEARSRALTCLERFGQRIRHLPPERVRAVGTSTLRKAKKAGDFLEKAGATLGSPIEIISGAEEARLVYLGVAQDLSDDVGTRLVVDIGGGSTECVLGERFEVFEAHSLSMGCVTFSERYFPKGIVRKKAWDDAVLAARAELQTIERRFRDYGWDRAAGSSGTIRTVQAILRENQWSEVGITPEGLKRLRKELLHAGQMKKVSFTALKSDRAPVFPGGVAILTALFEALGVERMEAATGALREGVLYDLLGRIRHEDVRERTIRTLQTRYQVDLRQAARVERNALEFLRQAAPGWQMDPIAAGRFLTWAARLHEIGLALSYQHHHQHGEYLLANSDLPGFSRDDQLLLAAIVGAHRRKIHPEVFDRLLGPRRQHAPRLAALLRLAVLSNRARGPHPVPPFRLEGREGGLMLRYAPGWMERHALMHRDIERERTYLGRIGFELDVAPDAAPDEATTRS